LNLYTWVRSRVFGTEVTWITYSSKSKKEEILSGVLGGGMPGSSRQERSLAGIVSLLDRCSEKKRGRREVLLALSGFEVRCDGVNGLEIDAHGSSFGGMEMEWDIAKWKDRTYGAKETGSDIQAASGQYIVLL